MLSWNPCRVPFQPDCVCFLILLRWTTFLWRPLVSSERQITVQKMRRRERGMLRNRKIFFYNNNCSSKWTRIFWSAARALLSLDCLRLSSTAVQKRTSKNSGRCTVTALKTERNLLKFTWITDKHLCLVDIQELQVSWLEWRADHRPWGKRTLLHVVIRSICVQNLLLIHYRSVVARTVQCSSTFINTLFCCFNTVLKRKQVIYWFY